MKMHCLFAIFSIGDSTVKINFPQMWNEMTLHCYFLSWLLLLTWGINLKMIALAKLIGSWHRFLYVGQRKVWRTGCSAMLTRSMVWRARRVRTRWTCLTWSPGHRILESTTSVANCPAPYMWVNCHLIAELLYSTPPLSSSLTLLSQ